MLIRPRELGGVGWVKVDCIRTAKMAMAMLRAYNIPCTHLPVSVMIANKAISEFIIKHNRSVFAISRDELTKLRGPRFFRMGRMFQTEECTVGGGWRGHMVVAVEDKYLLDMTIDSANNADDRIFGLKPFWTQVPAEVLTALGKEGGDEFYVTSKSGIVSTYRGDPANQAFATMDAWTAWHELHESIISQCKARFDAIRPK
jgi:hypothetical protein